MNGPLASSSLPLAHVPVTVLSGLDRVTVDDLATGLLLRHDRLAVVYADPSTAGAGFVTVTISDSRGAILRREVELEHDCASCTLRSATIAALTDLARAGLHRSLVLHLHPGIEPDEALRGLCAQLPPLIRIDTHVSVLSPTWLDVLSGGSDLTAHEAAVDSDDDRFAATVLCSGIETATTIVLPRGRSASAWHEREREEQAILDLLAPDAVRVRLQSVLDVPDRDVLQTGRLDPGRLDPLAEYGIRDPKCKLPAIGSLTLVRWQADRPLHPLRLQDALDQLADGVIRSSGRLDVADQPDSVVGWDSAGESLLLGPVAPCLEHPECRRSALAFLGDDLDADRIRAALDRCLVTDEELAILNSTWDHPADDLDSSTRSPELPGENAA